MYEGGLALNLLMVEPDAPIVVAPFSTVSGFQVIVAWDSGASVDQDRSNGRGRGPRLQAPAALDQGDWL